MAYATKYQIDFKNNDEKNFSTFLLLKDYTGSINQLTAGPNPFILSYTSGDDKIINPIRASECELNFYNEGSTPLTTFYSEDDEAWRIDFYYNDPAGAKLIWSGFIVQDNCQETFQDVPYLVTLKGTDNLALLKDITFDEAYTDTAYIVNKLSLFDFVKYSLIQTGISLPFAIYANIYENTMSDRQDDPTNEMFRQTRLFSGMFVDENGIWLDCYSILEKILFPLRATLCQAQGRWNIIRFGEFKLTANNTLPGSLFDTNFDIYTAVNLAATVSFAIGSSNILINADQTRRILRPFKEVKFTFNYQQPKYIINYNDLQFDDNIPPYNTFTQDNIRYDDYGLLAHFTTWKHTHGDTSFLRIETDVSSGNEIQRYVVTPAPDHNFRGVQFNEIEVSAKDVFDYSFQYRTPSEPSGNYAFWFRIILVTPNNQYYHLTIFPGSGSSVNVHWTGPFPVANWDDLPGVSFTVLKSAYSSQWNNFSLSSQVEQNGRLPLIPEDGILLIEMRGNNDTAAAQPLVTVNWKDFHIDFTSNANEFLLIKGHTHLQTLSPIIKNRMDEEISIDNSPRNVIQGTLFTGDLINFQANIGQRYFIKTLNWHRFNLAESKRLGEITTFETEDIQSKPRTILEGSFKYDDPTVSILNVVQVDSLPSLNFVFGVATFDFMKGIFSATLWEIYANEEGPATTDYSFNFIYETK